MARALLFGNEPPRPADLLLLAGMALALVLMPIVFWPALYDDFTLPKQATLFVAAALVLVALAMDGFPLPASRPLRIAVGAWLVLLVLSEFAGLDPRGGLLGVYQYRQGFLTQACYVALFLGSSRATERGFARSLLALPAAGLSGVFVYTFIQAVGQDPIDWWLDTSDRAIGTIGNANELAAYAIIGLAAAAPFAGSRARYASWAVAGVSAAVSFIVFEAESRSGLGALLLFVLLLAPCWWIARRPLRDLARPALLLFGGIVAGAALSLAAGGLAGTASRVQSGVAGDDAGGSTRISLWKGTLRVVQAEPLLGAGPDGLWLAFPRHRPADLGGAFDRYDLIAQSSHNYALDTAANAGLPGLLALGSLVVLSAAASISRTRGATDRQALTGSPFAWAALAAYGAITLLNPLSIAAHAMFFVVLGLISSEARPQPRRVHRLRRMRALIAVGPAAAGLVLLALLLPLADLEADNGWLDYDGQRFEAAAGHYDRATGLMPIERRYAGDEAEAHLAAGAGGDAENLRRAADAFEQFDEDFGFSSGEALSLAAARFGLENQPAAILAPLDEALALNPHGISIAEYAEQVRRAVEDGGSLRYSDRDNWTYIEPDE